MWLEKLHLTYFKSYEEGSFTFGERVNCLVGENGSGKTNLLDAIYFLALTKSAFHNQDAVSYTHLDVYKRQVESLMESTLPHGTISKETDAHVARFVIFFGKGNARSQRNLCPHDAVAAHEVALLVEDVHGATFTLGGTRFFTIQLGHDSIGAGAQCQRHPVIAVGGNVLIVGSQGRGST